MATDPDARVWLHNPETGGYFECPAGAVEHWKALGWQAAAEPPATPNPVVAELVAWREAQAAEQAAQAAEQAAQAEADSDGQPPTTTRPRRGAPTETPKE